MNWAYGAGYWTFRIWFRLYFRWRVYHPERVPTEGPVILAANHASFLDPPLVGSGLSRDAYFLARDTLFRGRLARAWLTSWNAIPVDRKGGGAQGVKTVLALLKQGKALILFPEGTRTRDGRLQPVRSGIGMLALRSEVPVVPVRIFGSYEAFGRHLKWPRPHRLIVKYGDPLDLSPWRKRGRNCSKEELRDIYVEIAHRIMAAIANLKPCKDKTTFP